MIISFETFLKSIDDRSFWKKASNFCFAGQEFPARFFSDLFKYINNKNFLPAPLQQIALHSTPKESLQIAISQSFLGSQTFYWLSHCDESIKSNQGIILDLFSYQGPNYVSFFTTQTPSTKYNGITITIEQSLNIEHIILLQKIMEMNLPEKKIALIKRILKKNNTSKINIDAACMLLNYVELTSIKTMASSEIYLSSLINEHGSLNLLSEYFFARNQKLFFSTWARIHQEYPEIFWITFWSEQLWRAIHVVKFLSNKNFVLAKKMSFRLPYSFIKNDWQLCSADQLKQSYEFLYAIDYALKRGSTFPALDLFYIRYFQI